MTKRVVVAKKATPDSVAVMMRHCDSRRALADPVRVVSLAREYGGVMKIPVDKLPPSPGQRDRLNRLLIQPHCGYRKDKEYPCAGGVHQCRYYDVARRAARDCCGPRAVAHVLAAGGVDPEDMASLALIYAVNYLGNWAWWPAGPGLLAKGRTPECDTHADHAKLLYAHVRQRLANDALPQTCSQATGHGVQAKTPVSELPEDHRRVEGGEESQYTQQAAEPDVAPAVRRNRGELIAAEAEAAPEAAGDLAAPGYQHVDQRRRASAQRVLLQTLAGKPGAHVLTLRGAPLQPPEVDALCAWLLSPGYPKATPADMAASGLVPRNNPKRIGAAWRRAATALGQTVLAELEDRDEVVAILVRAAANRSLGQVERETAIRLLRAVAACSVAEPCLVCGPRAVAGEAALRPWATWLQPPADIPLANDLALIRRYVDDVVAGRPPLASLHAGATTPGEVRTVRRRVLYQRTAARVVGLVVLNNDQTVSPTASGYELAVTGPRTPEERAVLLRQVRQSPPMARWAWVFQEGSDGVERGERGWRASQKLLDQIRDDVAEHAVTSRRTASLVEQVLARPRDEEVLLELQHRQEAEDDSVRRRGRVLAAWWTYLLG